MFPFFCKIFGTTALYMYIWLLGFFFFFKVLQIFMKKCQCNKFESRTVPISFNSFVWHTYEYIALKPSLRVMFMRLICRCCHHKYIALLQQTCMLGKFSAQHLHIYSLYFSGRSFQPYRMTNEAVTCTNRITQITDRKN